MLGATVTAKDCVGWLFAALLILPYPVLAQEVGVTDGEPSVDPTGAANFRIPIAVPPGRGGMQPELAFLYHSRGGNNQLGVGWSLEGISAISRCPATYEPDGYAAAVRMRSTDRFCLDGQKLISTGGGNYRTELWGFREITSSGGVGTGPQSFKVRTNSGLILDYGTTADSRVIVDGSVLTWTVSRISDLNGNSIEFTYDPASGHNFRVSEINYAPNNKVKFFYEDREDDPISSIAGSTMRLTERLKRIEISHGGAPTRDYQLSYVYGHKSGRSLLSSITQCVTGTCLPPTTFEWQQGAKGFSFGEINTGITWDLEDRQYLDLDGDGWLDLMFPGSGSAWHVRYGPDWGDANAAEQFYGCSSCTRLVQPFDWRGDGRINAFLTSGNQETFLIVEMANFPDYPAMILNDTGIPVDDHPLVAVVDLDGDGASDLVSYRHHPDITGSLLFEFFKGGFGQPFPSTPTKTLVFYGNNVGAGGILRPMQFFGPGQNAVLVDICRETVTDCVRELRVISWEDGDLVEADAGPNPGIGQSQVLDANGDGLPDLLFRYELSLQGSHGQDWHLLLNNGSELFNAYGTIPYDMGGVVHQLDWRGDGTTTLLVARDDGTTRWDYYMHGTNGFEIVESDPLHLSEMYMDRVDHLDVNADGISDRFHQAPGGIWKIISGRPVMNDLLTKVVIGSGRIDRETRFQYVPMSNPSFYEKGAADIPNDYLAVSGSMYVVAHVGGDTGATDAEGMVFTSYRYARGLAHRYRGFAGFEEVSALNENNQTHTTNWHEYRFPFTGQIRRTEQHAGNATIVSKNWADSTTQERYFIMVSTCSEPGVEDLNPAMCDFDPPPQAPGSTVVPGPGDGGLGVLVSTSETQFDRVGSGSSQTAPLVQGALHVRPKTVIEMDHVRGVRTRTDYQTYDAYGSVENMLVTIDDGDGHDVHTVHTANTFENWPSTWCLGRLKTATVTHTAPSTLPSIRKSRFDYLNCQLTSEVVEPGSSEVLATAYGLDAFGNRVSTTVSNPDDGVRTTLTTYDSTGTFVRRVVNALGHSEERTWNGGNGTLDSQTGPNGVTTSWLYDKFGRKKEEVTETRTKKWVWDWCAQCIRSASKYKVTITESSVIGAPAGMKEYDKLGREVLSGVVDFYGNMVYELTDYDAFGRVQRKSLPTATPNTPEWTHFTYDEFGRVTKENPPIVTGDSDATKYFYNGLETTITSFDGTPTKRTVRRRVNVMDRLVEHTDVGTDPHGDLSTYYHYDAVGNMKAVVDAMGSTTSMGYTLRGFKENMSAPGMGTWSYVHNAFGELTQQVDARGVVTTQQYDALGRMTRKTEDATGTTPTVTNWVYDSAWGAGIGKLAYVETTEDEDGDGDQERTFLEAYAYDGNGLLTDTVTVIDGEQYWVSTDYDVFGRVLAVHYPDVVTGTPGAAPAMPASITASAVDPDTGSFTLQWAAVAGSDVVYQIQFESVAGDPTFAGNWTPVYNRTAPTTTSLIVTGRPNDTYHRYKVRACTAACSDWREMSGYVHVLYRPEPPGPAQPFPPTSSSTGEVLVSWVASPSPSISHYELEQKEGANDWVLIMPHVTGTDSGALTLANGDYTFQVTAVNTAGHRSTPPSVGQTVTVLKPPSPPTSATAFPELTATGDFQVTWTPPADGSEIDEYLVEERRRNDAASAWGAWSQPANATLSGTTLTAEDRGGGQYQYRVRSRNNAGESSWAQSNIVTMRPVPWEPTDISVPTVQGAGGSFSFSWTKGYGAFRTRVHLVPHGTAIGSTTSCPAAYEPQIYEYDAVNQGPMQVCGVTGTTFTGFRPSGKYDVYLQSCLQGNTCIAPTLAPNSMVIVHPPSSVTASTHSSISGSVTIYWSYAGAADNFRLQRRPVSGSWTTVSSTISGSSRSYDDSSLGNGSYEYRVQTKLAGEWSSPRNLASPVSVLHLPGVPSSISVPSSSITGSYTVSWGTASGSVSRYELWQATNSSFSGATRIYNSTGKSKGISGIADGTYYYRVRACNASGCGGWRTAGNSMKVLRIPGVPTGLTAPSHSTGSFQVSWGGHTGTAEYYKLKRSPSTVYTASNGYYNFYSQPNGGWYFYVAACNASGCSAYSSPVYVTVTAGGPGGPGTIEP